MNRIKHPWRRRINSVTTVIIGAGHAGLAMSYWLTRRSIDHVVLERGEIANTWRKERWDSLRLLTPNWQSQLPGFGYGCGYSNHDDGFNPQGFLTMPETIDFITAYAEKIAAPVYTDTRVMAVTRDEDGYLVVTNQGEWRCRTLVIATGAFNLPVVPKLSTAIPESIDTLTANRYRNPQQLKDGGVLVVGASATGLQLTQEIQRSGRPVTLAVGEHVRLPRVYRGRDILWWMDRTGILDEHYRDVDDLKRVRRVPSPQLVGTTERSTLDLNVLSDMGVKLVGRFSGLHNSTAQFSGSLANVCKLADLKMARLFNTIDQWIDGVGWSAEVADRENFVSTRIDKSPKLSLNFTSGEIKTIIWATGFRPDYSWLKVPVLDRKGALCHDGGIVHTPGMYVMGLPFMRRRKSSYIHGAMDDARDLSGHLAANLGTLRSVVG